MDLYSKHTAKALGYGTRSLRISQFYQCMSFPILVNVINAVIVVVVAAAVAIIIAFSPQTCLYPNKTNLLMQQNCYDDD